MPTGAKTNMKTRISVIHIVFEEPAALKELDVREAASTTAQMGMPQKMNRNIRAMMRSGPKIMAST
jgi:hypothetical protein